RGAGGRIGSVVAVLPVVGLAVLTAPIRFLITLGLTARLPFALARPFRPATLALRLAARLALAALAVLGRVVLAVGPGAALALAGGTALQGVLRRAAVLRTDRRQVDERVLAVRPRQERAGEQEQEDEAGAGAEPQPGHGHGHLQPAVAEVAAHGQQAG